MGLWFVALAVIAAMVVVGSVATRRRSPEATHGWHAIIAVRVIGIVAVTGAVAFAAQTVGPLAAAVTGVLGVALFIWLLIQSGYARLPASHH